ncbi:MAG: site-specific integrase [Gammaproteobacteria bacterium]|nr:site-specific integrase [Gammaproteobacteria bacterium]
MGRKRTPGLYKRGEFWHIDKYICGKRFRGSTQTGDLEEAEKYLARQSELVRQAQIYGVRPKRQFREAATKYLLENQNNKHIQEKAWVLKDLDKYIGELPLESIHMGNLQTFIQKRKEDGVKSRTINYALQLIRHMLNLAATEWLDEYGMTWLVTAPKIKLLIEYDKRKPYPLSWKEQEEFFGELPLHLRRLALFAVNTGCRDQEICNLRWEWEIKTPEGSVFVIPGERVKNREDRLVVLNHTAKQVIEEVRGQHPEYVFTYKGHPFYRMMTMAWRRARLRVGLPLVRVHDLKHTFGRRLRSAGVNFEDRQDLLGHKSGRITTHYSSVELRNLITAANKVCGENNQSSPTLTLIRTGNFTSPHKIPTMNILGNSEMASNA